MIQSFTQGAMAWTNKAEDINPAFLDDIAQRVAEATGMNKNRIKKLIDTIIQNHYKKGNACSD